MRSGLAAILGCVLAAAGAGRAAAQTLVVAPGCLPASGEASTIELRRQDGRAFCPAPGCTPWVGASYGRLVRLPTRGIPSDRPQVLRARLGTLSSRWDPPPAAGETLIVLVYLGDRPISAPLTLPIGRPRAVSAAQPCETTKENPR